MRKLILAAMVILPVLAACQRSGSVLDRIPPGSQITVTTTAGRSISGRLAETRAESIVVQAPNGAPTTVLRADIAAVTLAVAEPKAASGAAAPQQPAPPPGQEGTPATREGAKEGTNAAVSGRPEAQALGEGAGAASAPKPAPEWREVTVPEGTLLSISLDESLASDRSRPEESVRATLLENVVIGNVKAIPAGSIVRGTVTQAKRSGKVKGVAELAVRFDEVLPKGADTHYRVSTGLVTRRAATTRRKDALKIGAPAAGGAIVGGLLGGKKGALIGTTVGGGAGTAVVLSTRGQEVRLPRGTRLSIKLLEPIVVRVPA